MCRGPSIMYIRDMLVPRSLAIAAIITWAGVALAADVPGHRMTADPAYGGGPCADRWVLGEIRERFAYAERRTWHRGYVMASLENPRPSGHPYAEPGLIVRDYCMADALMTNGDIRTVYYAIEYGAGFAGVGRYVDFCVLGLDPWHVHDGACRTVR